MITFASFTEEEMALAEIIVSRAMALYAEMGMSRPRLDVHMDLAAAHETCPLDLEILANFPDSDFGHDIGGINRHLNRETGELGDCFLPRCARGDAGGSIRETGEESVSMTDFDAAMIADGCWELTGYEESEENYLAAYQHLVDTGAAWTLQGRIGRMARDLIEAGHITR